MNSHHSQRISVSFLLIGLLAASVLLGACAAPVTPGRAAASASATPAMATAVPTAAPTLSPTASPAPSVPLEGKYSETLPAADASSRTIALELAPDKSARLITEFDGRPGSFIESGIWTASGQTVTVKLSGGAGRAQDTATTFELQGDTLVATVYDKDQYGAAGLNLKWESAATGRPPATGISETSLKNAEYRLPDLGTFRLTDGKFEYKYGSGATQVNRVGLLQTALGALDSSGKPGAVVFLALNTGGSGTFVYIVAMVEQNGQPQQMAAELLGDRVQVHSTTIKDGQIVVNAGGFSPSDPLCCPSQQITRTYRLDGNRLQVVSEVKATPSPVPSTAPARTQAEEPALAKIRYLPASHTCENAPASTIPAQWQLGARPEGTNGMEPGQPGKSVTLQMRNKLGPSDAQYQAHILVIAPDGSVTSADRTFKGNDWLTTAYPKDFPGAHPTVPGAYTVVYQLNGGYVACYGWEVVQ